MSLSLPKTCSVGGSKTGLAGTIGVTLLNPDGTTHTARATADIYEIGGGCYGKNISFDDNWKGAIKWDTGGGSPVYAVEEYDIEGVVDTIEEDTNELQGLITTSKIAAQVKGMDSDVLTAAAIAADAIGASEFAQAAADKVRTSVCVTGDPANSVGKILYEIYVNRLTSARAGYLANINNANLATISDISTLTATEIAYLNASISSRSSHTAANVWSAANRELSTPADYKADVSALALEATLTDIKGTGFVKDTHSLPQCLTATGFSTHAAADIWSVITRTLTGKSGFSLSTEGILSIWDQPTANIVTANTIGKLLKDDINATISSRSSHNAAAVWSAGSRELSTPDDYKADVSALASASVCTEARLAELDAGNLPSDINRLLGLVHENIYIDNPSYDANNNLISGRLRTYSAASSVGTDNDILATYTITAVGDGGGKFTSWKMVKQ